MAKNYKKVFWVIDLSSIKLKVINLTNKDISFQKKLINI